MRTVLGWKELEHVEKTVWTDLQACWICQQRVLPDAISFCR